MNNLKSIIKPLLKILPLRIKKPWEYQRTKLLKFLLAQSGEMVYSGPFSSMPIPSSFLLNHELYYILGSYEKCIHGELYKLAISQPKYGIVIGAHKGYYPVGLLYIIHNCKITAFESSEIVHSSIKRWAEVTNVSHRLEICGTASIESLQNLQDKPDFVIIDCEGAENLLLRPDLVPWLSDASIICELHDFYVDGLLGTLIKRFSTTHCIRIIDSYPVSHSEYPLLSGLSESEARQCVKEDRWIQSKKNLSLKIYTSGRFLTAFPLINLA
jgi:hypothetical protein